MTNSSQTSFKIGRCKLVPWSFHPTTDSADWVQHYNHERYHESLDNVTPADMYQGRRDDILAQRAIIKSRTMMQRKVQNLRLAS